MKKIWLVICFVCVMLTCCFRVFADGVGYVVTEEYIDSSGYYAVERIADKYYESVDGERHLFDSIPTAVSGILQLPIVSGKEIYKSPTEIEGVSEDIPFNYFADKEQSAKYVFSLLEQGFKIVNYSASPRVISFTLETDQVRCRVLIFDDYLKVYMPGKEDI